MLWSDDNRDPEETVPVMLTAATRHAQHKQASKQASDAGLQRVTLPVPRAKFYG